MTDADLFRILGNEKRLRILEWLKDPAANFPPQVHGDLVRDGVCGQFIADKLEVTPSTLSEHMRLLVESGLVVPKRMRQWTFYRREPVRAVQIAAKLAGRV